MHLLTSARAPNHERSDVTLSRFARLTLPLVAAALIVPLAAAPAAGLERPESDVDSLNSTGVSVELEPSSDGDSVSRVSGPAPELNAAAAGTVTGRVLVTPIGGGSPVPATSGATLVRFWLSVGGVYQQQGTTTTFDSDGDFSVEGLPAGTYRIEVLSFDGGAPGKAFYLDEEFWVDADEIAFNEGAGTNLPTITVDPITIATGRIAGADRYATSVAISQSLMAAGEADVVYLVNGLGYADALSAGPAAGISNGVVLLTRPDQLPSVVATELARLDPARVVIAGGTSAIGSRVVNSVRSILPTADIDRIAGADRYATSRAIVADAWPEGATVVGIATGRNFPDALALGAAVGSTSGPVVLVDGARSSLDSTTRSFLTNLAPASVAIAGGPVGVSNGIQQGLNGLSSSPSVQRFGGDDRYETARLINDAFFSELAPDYAFIATGAGFADALAGGPLAIGYGAPIHLSTQRCLDAETANDIVFSFVREVYALGGTAVLSNRVINGSAC